MTNSNTPQKDALSKELELARYDALQAYRSTVLKASMDYLMAQIRNKVKDAHKHPTYVEMWEEVQSLNVRLDALADQFHNA